MSECRSIDCCETALYTYGLTGTLTPGPPIVVDPPGDVPVYRLMLFDSFNGENGGVPKNDYDGWLNWENPIYFPDIFGPTNFVFEVDLRDSSTAGYPGSLAPQHLFVDMLGSSQYPPGVLQTKQTFTFVPGTYRLSFLLAGSQIGPDLTLQLQIGTVILDPYFANTDYENVVTEHTYSVPFNQGFVLQTLEFVVTSQVDGRIKFRCDQPTVGIKNAGVLVDDVKLEQIA